MTHDRHFDSFIAGTVFGVSMTMVAWFVVNSEKIHFIVN